MEVCTTDSGKMDKNKGMACNIIGTATFTKASGQTARGTDTAYSISKTAASSRASGTMTK